MDLPLPGPMQGVFDVPPMPMPHSIQPSPVSRHRQVSSAPQTATLTPSAPCMSTSQLLDPAALTGALNDESWARMHRPQQRQLHTLGRSEDTLQRVDTIPNEVGQFDFTGVGESKSMWTNSLSQNVPAPSWLQSSQPCSVVVPAYSSKQRLRDFSYEPPRSRAPLRYYYPVRSRSSTPRREYSSPTPRYMNALKSTYGTMPSAQPAATATAAAATPAPQPTTQVWQTAAPAPACTKSLAPGSFHGGSQQTLAQYLKQVPTPGRFRNAAPSAMPTTLAPSGSSYLTSGKDSAPTSLCSTVNRTNQACRLQPQPVPTIPGQSAHSLLGPAARPGQPTDLVQTIQLTQADLQERMSVKQQQQQVQEKEQELQLTKVSLEEKDRELAKRDKELMEKEGELCDLRRSHEEQVARKEEDIAERDKTILHLQATAERFEQDMLVKDDWCRKRDEAARNLEGKLRSERSAFEAQSAKRDQELEQKTQEVRDRENELRKKEREVDSLRDQARKLEDQVRQERRASEDLEYKNQGLVQELHLRNRQLQEQSEEMANYIRELDAQSRGDIPSVIKEVRQAREEDPENALLKERLAKSEADVELLRQWKDHEGHR